MYQLLNLGKFVNRKLKYHFVIGIGKGELYYDVAVLHLNESLVFTRYIRPICLPESSLSDLANRFATVIGWGDSPSQLLQAHLQIYSESHCNKTFKADNIGDNIEKQKSRLSLPTLFNSAVLCAGFVGGGIGSCPGDSGGPLVTFSQSTNMNLVVEVIES